MKKLINIKNQIHIKNKNNEDDIIKLKFKDIIRNFDVINEYMKIILYKGSSLPIKNSIKINIKYNESNIEYYLGKDKYDFEDIRQFLFEAKNDYIF